MNTSPGYPGPQSHSGGKIHSAPEEQSPTLRGLPYHLGFSRCAGDVTGAGQKRVDGLMWISWGDFMGKYDEILVGYSSNPDGPPVFGGFKWAIHLVFYFWGGALFSTTPSLLFSFCGMEK